MAFLVKKKRLLTDKTSGACDRQEPEFILATSVILKLIESVADFLCGKICVESVQSL